MKSNRYDIKPVEAIQAMLNRTFLTRLLTLTSLTLAAVLFLARPSAARAQVELGDPGQDYREAMGSFLPAIESWAADLSSAMEAATAKPELACSEEMLDLGRRGFSIVADLEGTARLAPRPLRFTHHTLTHEAWMMSASAMTICGDDIDHLVETADEAEAGMQAAMQDIRDFVNVDQAGLSTW